MTRIGSMLRIVYFTLMLSVTLFATEVEVVPKSPLVGESFNLVFKLDVKGGEEPYISFDSGNAEVVGKSQQGLSISTQIINGKISTKRELNIVYELTTDQSGPLRISNIKVESGQNEEKLKDINLTVLAERERPKDIFGLIVASKQKVYVGEAIDVGYYIYYRTQLGAFEILNFPKLNGFIKRFRNPDENAEAADYSGNVYRRSEKYAATLFPEKAGSLVLDPVKFKVQYTERSDQGQFGGFGFGMSKVLSKDIATNRIELVVVPLPAENVPSSFSGLVGEHEFKLEVPKTKFLVNEPVEVKLIVQGPGALEKFEAPAILKHANLEEFDKKVEVIDLPNRGQRKVIEYTFLARGDLKLDEKMVEVSYFLPSTGQYVKKNLPVPAILVEGGSYVPAKSNEQSEGNSEKHEQKAESSAKKMYVLAPNFSFDSINIKNIFPKLMLFFLSLYCLFITKGFFSHQVEDQGFITIAKNIKKNGVTYSNLTKLAHQINEKLELRDAFKQIRLDSVSFNKLLEVIEKTERMNYSEEGEVVQLKMDRSLINKVLKGIKNYKDDNQ